MKTDDFSIPVFFTVLLYIVRCPRRHALPINSN